jgi:hypothetical protein
MGIVWLEGLGQLEKKSVTSSGLEPLLMILGKLPVKMGTGMDWTKSLTHNVFPVIVIIGTSKFISRGFSCLFSYLSDQYIIRYFFDTHIYF